MSAEQVLCPKCGNVMNHHASKLLQQTEDPSAEANLPMLAMYSCPACGESTSRTTHE